MNDDEDVRKKFTRIELFAQARNLLSLPENMQKTINPYYYYQSANYYRSLLLNIAWHVDEIFIPINGFNDYLINNYGRVYYISKNILLCPFTGSQGYKHVNIIDNDGKRYKKQVHRLIMLNFNYFPGCINYQVNHIDGDKNNNYFNPLSKRNNLEWCTAQQNTEHAVNMHLRDGIDNRGSNNGMAVHTEEEIEKICQVLEKFPKINSKELANIVEMKYNSSFISLIKHIRSGRRWTHISKKYKILPVYDMFTPEIVHNISKLMKKEYTDDQIKKELNLPDNESIDRRINLMRQGKIYRNITEKYNITYKQKTKSEKFTDQEKQIIIKGWKEDKNARQIIQDLGREYNVNLHSRILHIRKLMNDGEL